MMQLWVQIQLSVIIAYLMHLWIARVAQNSREPAWRLRKWSQFIFILALFSPILVPLRASEKLPIPNEIKQPLAETGVRLSRPIRFYSVSNLKSGSRNINHVQKYLVNLTTQQVLTGIFLLSLIFGIAQLITSLIQLFRLLRSSFLLHRSRAVNVAVSSQASVPFSVWFFGRNWVVIPESLLTARQDFRISLRHELQHIRSNDTLWVFWLECVQPFFSVNPFFKKYKNALLDIQELACDESVLLSEKFTAVQYGECLFRVAERALNSRNLPGFVSGMVNVKRKSHLERRIHMLFEIKRQIKRSLLRFQFAVVAVSGVVVATAISISAVAGVDRNQPKAGTASVDPKFQAIAEKHLFEACEEFKATAGFALVSEAKTGRLLAVANISSEPAKPHLPHWALSLRLEPASVMKAIVTAAALDAKVTRTNEMHNCEKGKLMVGEKEYNDWKPFDKLSTAESVAQSSNICGIKIAQKLGAEKISAALLNFGFGDPEIGAAVPEARVGLMPEINDMGVNQYVARVSSGYGFYATPLEVVQIFGAIANGGNLFAPSMSGVGNTATKPLRRVLREDTAQQMKEILGLVMTHGTATKSQGKKFKLAGKTGTAQSPWLVDKDIAKDSQVAHFVGFGPIEDPKYVVYVGVQDPKNEEDHKAHGSSHAAPVFRKIIEEILSNGL